MERRASKKAKKCPKRATVCCAASVTATEDLEEASIEQQHSFYASSESDNPLDAPEDLFYASEDSWDSLEAPGPGYC